MLTLDQAVSYRGGFFVGVHGGETQNYTLNRFAAGRAK
jgi:hypothetical protein